MIGAGSWGTALALALSLRFSQIALWARDPRQAEALSRTRENQRYLPGFSLPSNLIVSGDLAETLSSSEMTLLAVPSAHLRSIAEAMRPQLPAGAPLVIATKGIEEHTFCRMSQVVSESVQGARVAVLSGPTFAREIAAGEPAAVVIAADDIAFATEVQQAFATRQLRFYTSSDVVGVEIGAALKNVIAIAAGVCRGLGLGSNIVAALVTRGLAEITRLAEALGASPRTLQGLAGLGDLVLTATGDLSRNRFVGEQLGRGRQLDDVLAGMTMVAEGVGTCRAACQLAARHSVDLPIAGEMHEILYAGKDPQQAIRDLMSRPLTGE